MASALPLDDDTQTVQSDLFPDSYFQSGAPDTPSRGFGGWLSDQARNLQAGTYGTIKDIAGAIDLNVDPEATGLRQTHQQAIEALSGAEQEARAKMSTQGQRELGAAIIPGGDKETIWSLGVGGAASAIATKAIGSAPSVVASILGTVLGGGVGGYVTAGAITAGQVYNDARDMISKMPADELAEKNPLFAGYLTMMPEDEARALLLQETTRNKALLMGTVTAATSKFLGIEGRLAGGSASRATGRAAAAVGEAVQEGTEQAAQSGIERYVKEDVTRQPVPFDWHEIANQVAESMLVGGVMGGAVGGGHRGTPAQPGVVDQPSAPTPSIVATHDPAVVAAAHTATNVGVPGDEPVPGGPVTPQPAAPTLTPAAAATPSIVTSAGNIDPVNAAALAPNDLGEDPDVGIQEDVPIPAPPQEVSPVTPQMQRAITVDPTLDSQGRPLPEVPAAPQPAVLPETPARVVAETPETPPAASPVAPEAIPAPVAPGGKPARTGRVLGMENVRPVGFVVGDEGIQIAAEEEPAAPVVPRMSASMKEQAAAGKEVLPVREAIKRDRAEAVKNIVDQTRAAMDDLKYNPGDLNTAADMRGYINNLVSRVDLSKLPKQLKGEPDPLLQHIAAARVLRQKGGEEALRQFMMNDHLIRQGAGEVLSENRKAQQAKSEKTIVGDVSESIITASKPGVSTGKVQDEQAEAIEQNALAQLQKRQQKREPETSIAGPHLIERMRASRELRRSKLQQYAAPVAAPTRPIVIERRRSKLPKPGSKASNPIEVKTAADLKAASATVEQPRSPEEAESGGYSKGHMIFAGLPSTIETVKGGIRQGTAPDGTTWKVKLKNAYGYFKRTVGADSTPTKKAQIDAYFGPNPQSEMVFVVDQQNLDGKFDEHKVLVGFNNAAEARAAYNAGFSDDSGPQRMKGMRLLTRQQLRQWVRDPQLTPIGEQVLADATPDAAPATEAEAAQSLQTDIVQSNEDIARAMHGDVSNEDLDAILRTAARRARGERPAPDVRVTSVGKELTQAVVKGADTAPDLMRNKLAERMRKLVSEIPVRIVTQEKMMEEWAPHMERSYSTTVPLAFYNPATDEIVIREDVAAGEQYVHALMHESSHAAYDFALTTREDIQQDVSDISDAFVAQLKREAQADGRVDEDGNFDVPREFTVALRNAHEFVAEAHSNPLVQAQLAKTPATSRIKGQKPGIVRTAWDMFIHSVKKVIGRDIPNTALEQMIRVTQQLDQQATQTASGAPLMARALNPAQLTLNVRDTAGDVRGGFGKWLRNFGLGVRSLDQIVQDFRRIFHGGEGESNPLERVQLALQRAGKTANEFHKRGLVFAEQFAHMTKHHHDEAENAANIMIAARINDVNLGPGADNTHLGKDVAVNYQAKAELARLNAAYDQLQPATRQFIQDASNFFKEAENETRRAEVARFLDNHNSTFASRNYTPEQLVDLTRAVLNGKLTDAHRDLIDDANVFSALQNSAEFRAVKGMYFPLMRHGDHVVTTWDRLGDLHGGREVSSDKRSTVIEWTADKDATARAMYKAYAESSNLKITSVGKVRRAMDGTVLSEMDAKGVPHTISYRARVNRQGVYFFDTDREASRFIRENRGQFERIDPRSLKRMNMEASGDLTSPQMAMLMNSVERSSADKSTKALMRATMQQASIRMMSGNRVQHRSLAARGVAGASTDMARNIIQHTRTTGNYLGKLRHMDGLRSGLADMRDIIDKQPQHVDNQARGQVLTEVEGRVFGDISGENSMEPQAVRDIMALSYLDKLFSPAYSVINGMQPWMVTMPVLAGRYGPMRAGFALSKAYVTIGAHRAAGSGLANTARATRGVGDISINSTDPYGSIRQNVEKADDGQMLGRMLDTLNDRIPFQEAGFEMAGAIAAGRKLWGTGLARVDRIARQLPLAVEVINRSVTAIAAYRLARSSGMDHDDATKHAYESVQNTQGDYSGVNQPRLFNNVLLRPALQFKKYAQMMSYLMVDMTKRAFGPDVSRRERMVALKQLGYVVGVQIAMAGAMGLPGLELVKVIAMLAGALGLGSGWDDTERYLRRLADESMGKYWGELVTRGVLSRAAGIDLSTRVSLADMWTFGEPKTNDRQGAFAYFGTLMAGAPGGLVADVWGGIQDAGSGNYMKALEQMIPVKFVSDTLKAVRGRTDEAASIPIQTHEAFIQAAGFRTSRMAEAGEALGTKIAAGKKLEARKKELQSAWMNASTKGEQLKVQVKIAEHNKAAKAANKPTLQVSTKGLDKAKVERKMRRDELLGAN